MPILPRYLLLILLALCSLVLVPSVALAEGEEDAHLSAVRQGFDLLMDRLVYPTSSDVLLGAGWRAVLEAAEEATGERPVVPTPLLTGSRGRDWEVFQAQWATLSANQDQSLDRAGLASAVLRGMATAVGEGHTVYMDPERYQEHLAWMRGDLRYAGIGARIAGADGTVVEVFEGSPAEHASLRVGDRITHVDGLSVDGRTLGETIQQVRGSAGSPVYLTVRRLGVEEPFTLEVVRAEIQIVMVQSRMVADGIGYVRLRSFPEPSIVEQIRSAVAGLREQGASGLVLDLRGNSGGRLDVGSQLLGMFVDAGALYQQTTRDGASKSTLAQASGERLEMPLAVLVDGGTASMGEIFASAIQEHEAGWIVGETTAGNVAAAQVFPLVDGSALQVTVMEIRSGQGEPLNRVGVVPDVLVATSWQDLHRGVDNPLQIAVDLLTRPALAPAQRAA